MWCSATALCKCWVGCFHWGTHMAFDRDQTNFSQKMRFKIWTVYEVGMKFKHFKRERVLHDDRIEIVPNPKHFGVVLQSTVLTNCKQAPTPSAVGSVKQKFDDGAVLDMQERRFYRGNVGSLQYLSIDCLLWFAFRDKCLCEGDEATDRSFMDTTESIGPIFGKSPVRVLLILEQTMHHMVHFFASLVGQWFGWKCQGQEKSIEFETWGRWMSAVFCIKQTEVTRALKWWSWVLRCSIDHQWSNVDPRSLFFTGLEVLTELLLDSAAARGRCRREGVGTICHLSRQVLWLQQLAKRGVITVGACVHPQITAQIWRKSLFVHRFRQLMRWNGLVLDRHEKSVISDTEDGQGENDQRGTAVQTICDLWQGGGGALDALGKLVRTIRGTNWVSGQVLGAVPQVVDTLSEDSSSGSAGHGEMAWVVVTQVYERTTCAWLLANATFFVVIAQKRVVTMGFLLMLCIRHCANEQQ